MDCLFCKISSGEIKSETVYEDKLVRIFKDIHPKAPVHLLVVSKEHIESIIHLKDDNNDIIAKMVYAAKDIAENLKLRGYKLVFNVGREGGQVIDHLHLHLLGGWSEGARESLNV